MHHFWALGALALLVAAGAAYRIATVLFFLGFTYVFLLESALYLNHFYLICLVSFMIFVPAHRAFSVDAALRPGLHRGGSGLGDLAPTIPGGRALLLRRHREARLRLAAGEPIRSWMVGTTDFPLVGETFTEEWMVLGASWFGLLDLLVVPGLLWRRTRPFAFALAGGPARRAGASLRRRRGGVTVGAVRGRLRLAA